MRLATDDKRRCKLAPIVAWCCTMGADGVASCLELTDDVRLEMVAIRVNLLVTAVRDIISLVAKATNKHNNPSTVEAEATATIVDALLSASLHRMHMELDLKRRQQKRL